MTNDPEIKHERTDTSGRYFVSLPDGQEAEMTYRATAPGVVAFDHTFVPRAFRGGDLAARLVQRGIDDARDANLRIVPQCSYVAAQFRRHPEWADLLAD